MSYTRDESCCIAVFCIVCDGGREKKGQRSVERGRAVMFSIKAVQCKRRTRCQACTQCTDKHPVLCT